MGSEFGEKYLSNEYGIRALLRHTDKLNVDSGGGGQKRESGNIQGSGKSNSAAD